MADLSSGADATGGERFGDCEYNDLKNHWRMPDPCGTPGLVSRQPGMIVSDENDDRLYVVSLASGCACSEILQACVPLSDDVFHGYGDGWEGILGYDELTNDALILGVPLGGTHRGLIICDSDDVVPAVSGFVPTVTQPTIYMMDADINGWLGLGHQADDRPGIWSGPDDSHLLAIQYEATADVTFFENCAADENRLVYIYGGDPSSGGAPDRIYGTLHIDPATSEFFISAENDPAHEGVTINLPEANQRFRIRQNSDILSMSLDGTDVFMRWSDGEFNFITDEGASNNTFVNIRGKGTGKGYLRLYDEDDAEFLNLTCAGGAGYIHTDGATPSELYFQHAIPRNIKLWGSIVSGNPYLYISGWITAGGARRYSRFNMDDTNDEFEMAAEDNANHEGITILISEADQKFRVRGAGRALRFYVKSDGEIGTNQIAHAGHSGGYAPGVICSKLPIYDENQNYIGDIPIYETLS